MFSVGVVDEVVVDVVDDVDVEDVVRDIVGSLENELCIFTKINSALSIRGNHDVNVDVVDVWTMWLRKENNK